MTQRKKSTKNQTKYKTNIQKNALLHKKYHIHQDDWFRKLIHSYSQWFRIRIKSFKKTQEGVRESWGWLEVTSQLLLSWTIFIAQTRTEISVIFKVSADSCHLSIQPRASHLAFEKLNLFLLPRVSKVYWIREMTLSELNEIFLFLS